MNSHELLLLGGRVWSRIVMGVKWCCQGCICGLNLSLLIFLQTFNDPVRKRLRAVQRIYCERAIVVSLSLHHVVLALHWNIVSCAATESWNSIYTSPLNWAVFTVTAFSGQHIIVHTDGRVHCLSGIALVATSVWTWASYSISPLSDRSTLRKDILRAASMTKLLLLIKQSDIVFLVMCRLAMSLSQTKTVSNATLAISWLRTSTEGLKSSSIIWWFRMIEVDRRRSASCTCTIMPWYPA